MANVSCENISICFDSRTLFEEVNVGFSEGNRYALTGPNGSGKSTFLKIIIGSEKPDSGQVVLPERVGVLKQNIEDFANRTVLDCVLMGNKALWAALEERDRLYDEEMTDAVGMRLGDLEEVIAQEDGYSADSQAEELLVGVGIEEDLHQEKMANISNDKQFRALLCQALFGDPQLLLLDEPTNHLDLSSIKWLESFLFSFSGTIIVTSHDRHFLNTIATHVADIDFESIIIYPGNYDNMVLAKTQAHSSQLQEAKSKDKKIDKLKEFVARFSAGSRSSQVQSRVKEIKKLEYQEFKKSNIQRPYIRFPMSEKQSGKIAFKIDEMSKAFDEKQVINGFEIEIEKGDKIGVIGNNGMGKTTLLKLIAQKLNPDKGEVIQGHQVMPEYFPQLHSDLIDKSKENRTVFDWMMEKRDNLYEQDIRSALGKMLFSGDDAFKTVATLSGGETARLILASMMLSEHNALILDEPNNHLDLESVSALAWGLKDYKGTAIVASHDRDLISQIANKIISITESGIEVFLGGLEEFLESKEKKA
ncbi:Uncharacterized ABC transporter ATP-binding protein YbiT [Chlamydiales bacterium SCGC AB-751-O23]|jgi:ATPase subunit of ABC transporter with duplicated ATPase domains|nr:Uncharacterized ABC transporter ATP-binding protein YbiT [Chlamydiales bacterium SCGC AB-751-O23]